MATEAPQWLISGYIQVAEELGATAPREQIEASCNQLITLWSSPNRVFHNLRHLMNTLAALDEIISASHNPNILRMAAWYHGAAFSAEVDSTDTTNTGEVMAPSANYARRDLGYLGIPEKTISRIAELIMTLGKHEAPEGDIDAAVLIDAEFSMLASPPQEYKKYRDAITAEYAHVPRAEFLAARKQIVEHLLAREPLFRSPLASQWEPAAANNLEAELKKLEGLIQKECEQAEGDCDAVAAAELPQHVVTPVSVPDPAKAEHDPETENVFSDPQVVEKLDGESASAQPRWPNSVQRQSVMPRRTHEVESDRSAQVGSTLEFADDCLDTAQMRAVKTGRNLAPGIPQMSPDQSDDSEN